MAVVMVTGSQSPLSVGTKTKLRGGGREGKGGEGEGSQEGARIELVAFN